MKASTLRDLSKEELQQKELELLDQLFKLRVQKATGKLENAARIRQVRKDLARVKTVFKEVGHGE